jgi:transposase
MFMGMFIAVVPNRNSRPTILLRETYREDGKVRNRTLANLTDWAPEKIAALSAALEAARSKEAPAGMVDILETVPHGHVHAVLGTLRRLGLEQVLLTRRCRERDLVTAMIVARVLDPGSKLSTHRSFSRTTLGEILDVADAKPEELYQALDWLLARQEAIEAKLAKRHLVDGSLLLYDLTSVYFEGEACELGRFGHSKEGRKDKLQILVGLLCNREGIPISIQVFEGNAAETGTLEQQIQKVRERFGLERIVFVADRGILRSVRIKEDLAPLGLDWITALRKPAIRELIQKGAFQPSLFEQVDFAEVEDPAYPGERLVVCRNPILAYERARRREELIGRTEQELQAVQDSVNRETRPLRGEDKIGLKVGAVLNHFNAGRFFDLTITNDRFGFHRNEALIREDAALDGFYVIRTSLDRQAMGAAEAVLAYKDLSKVEAAFRQMKTEDLEIRPVFHRLADRVKAHVFLCMLAYYIEWHLRRDLAPLLFGEGDPRLAAAQRTSPVQAAKPSPATKAKRGRKRTEDGFMVHNFRDLLRDLASLSLCTCHATGTKLPPFKRTTQPSPYQKRAFDLLQLSPP